jgi:hypothetical protein
METWGDEVAGGLETNSVCVTVLVWPTVCMTVETPEFKQPAIKTTDKTGRTNNLLILRPC